MLFHFLKILFHANLTQVFFADLFEMSRIIVFVCFILLLFQSETLVYSSEQVYYIYLLVRKLFVIKNHKRKEPHDDI